MSIIERTTGADRVRPVLPVQKRSQAERSKQQEGFIPFAALAGYTDPKGVGLNGWNADREETSTESRDSRERARQFGSNETDGKKNEGGNPYLTDAERRDAHRTKAARATQKAAEAAEQDRLVSLMSLMPILGNSNMVTLKNGKTYSSTDLIDALKSGDINPAAIQFEEVVDIQNSLKVLDRPIGTQVRSGTDSNRYLPKGFQLAARA